MTSPGGIPSFNDWLADTGLNVSPPSGTWISEFTSSSNLSQLHDRTQENIEEHYANAIELFDSWGIIGNFFGALRPILDWLSGLWDQFSEAVLTAFRSLFQYISSVIDISVLQGFIQDIVEFFTGILNPAQFVSLLKDIFSFFNDLLTGLGSGILGTLEDIFGFLKMVWSLIGEPILDAFASLFKSISDLINIPALQGFIEDIAAFFTGILNPAQFVALFKTLFSFVKGFIDAIGSLDILQTIGEFFDWLWGLIGEPVLTAIANLFHFISGLIDFSVIQGFIADIAEFFTGILNPAQFVALFKTVFSFFKGFIDAIGSLDILQTIGDFFNWLWELIGEPVLTAIANLFHFISGLIDFSAIQGFIADIAEFFTGLLNPAQFVALFKNVFSFFKGFIDAIGSLDILQTIGDFFSWLWELIGEPTLTAIGNLFNFVSDLIDITSLQGFIGDIAEFFTGILNPAQFVALFKQLFGFFNGLGDGTFLAGFLDVFDQVIEFFSGFLSSFGSFNIIETVMEFFSGIIDDVGSLSSWLLSLATGGSINFGSFFTWVDDTFIAPIKRALTGQQDAPDNGALGTWARNLLTANSPLDAQRLTGQLPANIFGMIPVSSIGTDAPNLLAQGSFGSSDSFIDADGWSWDSSQNRSGDGGSAKVVCDGTEKTLYSTQSIPVTESQKINVSCWAKTAGLTGALGFPVQLLLVPFIGVAAQTPVSVKNWVGIAPDTNWTPLVGTQYVVPPGVTSVRVALRIRRDIAPTGSVWFDDVVLTKAGLMQQSLVDSLTSAWEGFWNGVFGSGGTGKIWSDMQTALGSLSSTANTASGTAAGAATQADVANVNLGWTWNDLYDAFGGTTGSVGRTRTQMYTRGAAQRAEVTAASSSATSAAAAALFASGTASDAADVASSAASVASSANDNATTANTNLGLTWDDLYDAFGGTTGSTGRTRSQMYTRGAAQRSIITSAESTATSAAGTASSAAATASAASDVASSASSVAGTTSTNLGITWNNLYDAFGGTTGSTGRTAAQVYTRGAAQRTALTVAASNATAAAGTASTAQSTAVAASEQVTNTNLSLFGTGVAGSEIQISAVPTHAVGAVINPTSGSGAQISRRSTTNVGAVPGRVNFPTDFFDTTDASSSDITITRSSGKFTVNKNGWYLVELAFRLNPVISFGFSIAPLLFRNGSPYKIGNDAIMGTWSIGSVGNRYANSTWIVYLTAGQNVSAGYDAIGTGIDMFDADASGVETYFSIAMLNKTFA